MIRQIINDKTDYSIGERINRNGSDLVLETTGIERYKFASKFTGGKIVIDAACADGYGSEYLKATDYTGLDYHKESIEKAKKEQSGTFKVVDLNKCKLPKCDVFISFETIEHLEDPKSFLEKVKEITKEYIIISIPNNETPGANPHHKWITDENSFIKWLSDIFENFELYHQDVYNIDKNAYPLWLVVVIKL